MLLSRPAGSNDEPSSLPTPGDQGLNLIPTLRFSPRTSAISSHLSWSDTPSLDMSIHDSHAASAGAASVGLIRVPLLPLRKRIRLMGMDMDMDEDEDGKIKGRKSEDGEGGSGGESGSENGSESGRWDDERGESGEEDEYDWWAEELKPTKEKGFQSKGHFVQKQFRYREMVWKQRDGRWWGRWRWTKWEEDCVWEKRVEDNRERAICAWNGGGVPQEILTRIVESLVGPRPSAVHDVEEAARDGDHIERVQGLGNLALVCRAFHAIIAPRQEHREPDSL